MGIFSFIKRIKDKNSEEFDEKIEEYKKTVDYIDSDKDENIEINLKVEEKEIEEEPKEIIEEVKLTKEELDELIYNEILRIIDIYDDFEEVKVAAMEAAKKIGKENLGEIPKFLNGKIHRPAKYINKYFEDSEWTIVVENSILMIIYSFNENAVPILERISQKNSKLNLKATNLLCKLASEGVKTDEIVNWIMNNLIAFNDDNKIIILGFMSQIKNNNQVIGLIQHFYKVFIKNGEIEYAFKTLKHLINAAERFTQGHLKFLKYIAMGKESINLEEITMLEDGDPKTINFQKIDENLSIEAAVTYYSLDKNDDDINSKLYYLSEYSLDKNLRESIKMILNE
ncbi:hypothetical protein ACQPUY_00930 [Clostridium nigeriense]|uniref:hypothetical protein n=1 Tax=Clostridium nigeriense TaxID=1805470 RepID=UPI003D340A00